MSNLLPAIQHKINTKTKPLGALGDLEILATQICTIQQTLEPSITNPHVVVFAADHGIAATGLVNPYPQAVTAQMVLNFLNGGAAINVFCKQNNITLKVVNAGVNFNFDNINHANFIHQPIANGTANYAETAAMTNLQAEQAITNGKNIINHLHQQQCNIVGFGEMGISNTSSAALIMSYVLQQPIEQCVGLGTGVNTQQLATKINTLQQVYTLHLHNKKLTAVELLSAIGGFEIAAMVGAYIQAAQNKMIILVDGFIATSALLIAQLLQPTVINNCIFAHCSGEQGHQKMLQYLQAKPLLQLGLRLGEGTGAALCFPLVQAAVNFVNEMASFEEASVDGKL